MLTAHSSPGEQLILHSHADLGQEQESACCHLHALFIYKISGCYCPAPWLAARQRLLQAPLTHGSVQHLPFQPGSCQLPQDPIPPAVLHRALAFCCQNPPHKLFSWGISVSSSTSRCLLRNGSCAAGKLGELVLCPASSSLPKPPLSHCCSSRRESRDFEILPDGEGYGGAKLCKTQTWK